MNRQDKTAPGKELPDNVHKLIKQITEYYTADGVRFHYLGNDGIELYMQGKNLTMQLIVYVHNNHLVLRVPGFIKNQNLQRMDVLLFIMKVMNEILNIRFEIDNEGRMLSASCQHIIEDGVVTRKQFDMAMMVLLHIVDDTYPEFMKILFGNGPDKKTGLAKGKKDNKESSDDADEFAPMPKNKDQRNIN